MKAVSLDAFPAELQRLCEEYIDDVVDGIPPLVKKAAASTVKALRTQSPVETGDYRKGWRSKKTRARLTGYVGYNIHNKTDYQITHLLEFGHAKRGGGFVAARPHIQRIADAEGKKFEAALAAHIRGGR